MEVVLVRWVINSAVIAAGCFGTYTYHAMTPESACEWLHDGPFTSRIGYPECQKFLRGIAPDLTVPLTRELSPMDAGDEALVARLKTRIPSPELKGRWVPKPDDWELGLLRRID